MKLSTLARFTALLLISALMGNNFAYAAKKPVDPSVIKAKLEARGVGQGVRVTLSDQTDKKGTIISIGEQSFTLKPKGAAQPIDLPYTQIVGVHRDKLSTGAKVGIGVGIFAAAVGIVAIVIYSTFKL